MTLFFLTKAPKEEKFAHIFKLLDEEADGTLSYDELNKVVKHGHEIYRQLSSRGSNFAVSSLTVFQSMDSNHDLFVTKEEFVQACLKDQQLAELMEDLMGPLNKQD